MKCVLTSNATQHKVRLPEHIHKSFWLHFMTVSSSCVDGILTQYVYLMYSIKTHPPSHTNTQNIHWHVGMHNLYAIPKDNYTTHKPADLIHYSNPLLSPSLIILQYSPHPPYECFFLSSYPWLSHLLPFLSSVILDYFYILGSNRLSYCILLSLCQQLGEKKREDHMLTLQFSHKQAGYWGQA